MEEAGILVRGASEWGARSKFPPEKKGSDQLRVVHNFIPLNDCTVKPQPPEAFKTSETTFIPQRKLSRGSEIEAKYDGPKETVSINMAKGNGQAFHCYSYSKATTLHIVGSLSRIMPITNASSSSGPPLVLPSNILSP